MNTLDRMTAEVGRRSAEATRVWERFPPRMVPDRWDGACQDWSVPDFIDTDLGCQVGWFPVS
jgi:hypothetical protein